MSLRRGPQTRQSKTLGTRHRLLGTQYGTPSMEGTQYSTPSTEGTQYGTPSTEGTRSGTAAAVLGPPSGRSRAARLASLGRRDITAIATDV